VNFGPQMAKKLDWSFDLANINLSDAHIGVLTGDAHKKVKK